MGERGPLDRVTLLSPLRDSATHIKEAVCRSLGQRERDVLFNYSRG